MQPMPSVGWTGWKEPERRGEVAVMRRRGLESAAAAAVLITCLLLAGTAAGDPGSEKAQVDGQLGQLRDRAADAERRAGVLTEELTRSPATCASSRRA